MDVINTHRRPFASKVIADYYDPDTLLYHIKEKITEEEYKELKERLTDTSIFLALNKTDSMRAKRDSQYFERTHGKRQYELKNHLGNILATVTDRKIPRDNDSDGLVDYYTADIVTADDYYPFGMQMPGRHWEADSTDRYRFGFQGQTKDNSLKGHGNSYNFGKRIYDPRTGNWLSLDPMMDSFPSWSPYNAMKDNPLYMKDEEGGSPSAATSLLLYAGAQGAKSAALEMATQVTVNTLNNLAKQARNENKEVNFQKAFNQARKQTDYVDIAISFAIGAGIGGLNTAASMSYKMARVSKAYSKVSGELGDVSKAIFNEEGLANKDEALQNYTGSKASSFLKSGIKKSLMTGDFSAGVISGYAEKQVDLVGLLKEVTQNENNEPSYSREPGNPGGYKGF